jgi:hypothetical protein
MKFLILLFAYSAFGQVSFKGHKHLRDVDMPYSMEEHHHKIAFLAWDCSSDEFWNAQTGQCERRPGGDDFQTLMVHGNGFAVGSTEGGPRGVHKFAAPNWLMGMWSGQLTPSQVLTADVMLTAERWTFPQNGYPELLQIGETRSDGLAYIDGQHPHSSPIMGLTLSDTISVGENGQLLKISVAPRGQATEGPVAFMHRPTGVVNPDAPLGHHIGQDVAHVSSTVIAAAFYLNDNIFEVSGFHGGDPEPYKTNLPLGPVNSAAARWTKQIRPDLMAMISFSYVKIDSSDESLAEQKNSHRDEFGLTSEQRTSASLYYHRPLGAWNFGNTFIFGELDTKGQTSTQISFLDELTFEKDAHAFWGRLEALQRVPIQLNLNLTGVCWVEALTLGYTFRALRFEGLDLKAGVSGTLDFLPSDFRVAYGDLPVTGRVFLQISGMKMW